MATNNLKWTDERTAQLINLTNHESPVSKASVEAAAEALAVTAKSAAAKLRKLGVAVASMAVVKEASFSADEAEALRQFVQDNVGRYTYKEIATEFAGGKFDARKIQGKLLSMELTAAVKPAEKEVVVLKYTGEEEARFIELVESGAFLEDIADAFGKPLASVRGKALSLVAKKLISKIPTQKQSHAKAEEADKIADLGESVSEYTVAQLAELAGKTPRGVKTILTRRGIKAADYDGAAKRAKLETAKA